MVLNDTAVATTAPDDGSGPGRTSIRVGALALAAGLAVAGLTIAGCGRSAPADELGAGADTTATGSTNDAGATTDAAAADGTATGDGTAHTGDGTATDTTATGDATLAGIRVVSDEPIIVPDPADAQQTTTTATTFPVPVTQLYTVQSGDSLSVIAQRFGVSIDDIRRANPDIGDIDRIRAGDELAIPAAG